MGKRSHYIKTIVLLVLGMMFFSFNVHASTTIKLNDLVEQAKDYDGQVVTVRGEAIGESMLRGEYGWINISDVSNAIGIWLSKEDIKRVTHYGNYKYKGDTMQVTGTFHRACVEHGGEADIHNQSLTILAQGVYVKERISSGKPIAAILAFVSTSLLVFYFFTIIKKKL